MKKVILTSVLTLLTLVPATHAQVHLIKGKNFCATGVSNDGMVVGLTDLAKPYSLWNPETGEFREIGGIAEGDGHGGRAKFSADGKYIGGSTLAPMDWNTGWEMKQQVDADYTITGIAGYIPLLATGYNNADGKGLLLKSVNGFSWTPVAQSEFVAPLVYDGSLRDIVFVTDYISLMCGDKGFFAYSINKGASWTGTSPDATGQVGDYRTLDCIREDPYVCVTGAKMKNGEGAVFQSPDGAETWQTTQGVSGIPAHISHIGFTFYMVTENGRIQKSTDLGLHWTDVFDAGMPLHKIYFSQSTTGIALADRYIFRTLDGGKSWTKKEIDPGMTDNVKWNDLLWTSNTDAMLAGSDGAFYSTEDRGASWTKVKDMDTTNDLMVIANLRDQLLIGGAKGEFYQKNTETPPEVSMMGRYDVKSGTWQAMGTLGYRLDQAAGSSYQISGDGKVMVGTGRVYNPNSTDTKIFTHATVWLEDEGLIDLGGLHDEVGRSTRANAVSYDGSVIAGWQDQFGPWHGAVWRRKADGSYAKNEYILRDPSQGSTDLRNCAGPAHCVSQNGKWIGGDGHDIYNTATDSPWIWSEETGIIDLYKGYSGVTVAVNNEGTLAVGYEGGGSRAFIWTKEGGYRDFNEFVANELQYDLGNLFLTSILCMSPNGRYVCGWGISPNEYDPSQNDVTGFVADILWDPTGIENLTTNQCNAEVYPNPATDNIHIDLPYDQINTQIRLIDMQGRVILQQNTTVMQNTLSLNGVAPGLYIVRIEVDGASKSFKVEVSQ